jgi:hypothetical protein
MARQQKKINKNQKNRKMPARTSRRPMFGPVTAITTAPVSIGNSIRGSKPSVTVGVDGCRIIGRDFGFELGGTVAAATGWTLVGGLPLTPSVLPSSALRSYVQMYSKFKINALNVHYITSSATSQTGDIMFHYERDRVGPCVDWTNASFLPYVLSDPGTVIGPQWMNHTLMVKPTSDFRSTNYGVTSDLNEEASGTVFLFSKTSSASSPGYIILDYDISFKQLCVNPRAGILPISRGQWNKSCIGLTTTSLVLGSTVATANLQGNNISGVAAAFPTGAAAGDIYKIVFDVTNSTVTGVNAAWTNVSANSLLRDEYANGTDGAVTIDDGFTCYAVLPSTTTITLHPNLASAQSNSANGVFTYGVTNVSVTFNLCIYMSLVGSRSSAIAQFSY